MLTPPDAGDADPVAAMLATIRDLAEKMIRAASTPPAMPTDDTNAPEALTAWLDTLEAVHGRLREAFQTVGVVSTEGGSFTARGLLGVLPPEMLEPLTMVLPSRTELPKRIPDPNRPGRHKNTELRQVTIMPASAAGRRGSWLAARARALAMAAEIRHRIERFEKATMPAVTIGDANHAAVTLAGIVIFDGELPGDAADLLREFKTHREAHTEKSGAHRQAKKRLLNAIPALTPFIDKPTTRGDGIAYRWNGPKIS